MNFSTEFYRLNEIKDTAFKAVLSLEELETAVFNHPDSRIGGEPLSRDLSNALATASRCLRQINGIYLKTEKLLKKID